MQYKKLNIHLSLSIIIIGLLVFWIICCAMSFNIRFTKNVDAYYQLEGMCLENAEEIGEDFCADLKSKGTPVMPDTISVMTQLLINEDLCRIQLLAPIILFLLSGYSFSREYSTGFYKNKLTRMTYVNYLKSVLKSAYKNLYILPLFILVLFIASFIVSGHFDIQSTISYWGSEYIPLDLKYIENVFPFLGVVLINILLNSIFYVHLILIMLKKNHNLLLGILTAYLSFIFCNIFFEIFIGVFIGETLLNISQISNVFNLFNYWVYDSIFNLGFYTLFCFLLAVGSFIFLLHVYKNKEGVIIESEN